MRSPWTKWFILTYWKYDLAVHRLDFGMFSFLLWTLSLWNSLPYILKLLDFEGSTMTSGQFEQVKHQFVWPDMLLKRLIGKTSGHWERLLVQFWAISCFFFIEVHVVLKEVYVFYGTRGNHLHSHQPFKSRHDFKFYCLKKVIRFYSHMTSYWQMLFSDIFNG